ncbi:MAG: TIGR00730 family Rossman fold protein [Clostridia bacterium]
MRSVCVFGASSSGVDAVYEAAAYELGALLAERGIAVVFGGGRTGLMGAVARGVHDAGGHITGVIPEKLNVPGIPFEYCDKLIVTATMHERKAKMEQLSHGYIAMPGGLGTLEELLEVLTLNQLGYISAPVVILSIRGCYDALMAQLDACVAAGFTHEAYKGLYRCAQSAREAVELLVDFKPQELPNKIKEALKQDGKNR